MGLNELRNKYREKRKDVEEYFKERRSEKVAERLDKFYEDYFSDEETTVGGGVHIIPPDNPSGMKIAEPNPDLETGVEKIPEVAKKLKIPVEEVAGYCLDRFLFNAGNQLLELDRVIGLSELDESNAEDFLEGSIEDRFYFIMEALENTRKKMRICEQLAKKYNLGENAVEIAERNNVRLKRRERMVKTIEDAESEDEIVKGYNELLQLIEGQEESMNKEINALVQQEIGRWMKGN